MSSSMDIQDQALLNLTLKTRETIVKELTKNGLPADQENRDFLMKAMDGLDRAVIAKTKLKIEDKAAQNQANTARLISDILKRSQSRNTLVRNDSPILDDVYTVEDKIHGEDAIGVSTLTYDEFVNGKS